MIYGSVCSGIEAASVAWKPLGWKPAFVSEIEAAPRAVLKHRHPEIPLHGDFTTIREDEYGPIDLLVGGTPCQSFSVAGLRGGLADDRGNLSLEFLRLVKRKRPRWVVWENVPGVLSSTSHVAPDPCPPEVDMDMVLDGEEVVVEDEYDGDELHAFNSFLAGLSELGYGWAYRVLDTQYVRVDGFGRARPQRRRRVFVVGYLGDRRRAAAVFLERNSLRRDTPPRREARSGTARSFALSVAVRGRDGGAAIELGDDVGHTIRASQGGSDKPHVLAAFGGNDTRGPIEVSTALNAHGVPHGRQDFESETFVAQIAPAISASNPYGDHESREGLLVAHTLRADGFDASEDGTGRGTPIVPICFDTTQITSNENRSRPEPGDPCHPLSAQGHAPALALMGHNGGPLFWKVRRLTPTECERLQGYEDGYTLVPWRGGWMADGPRYKMLGNSMSVNVMRWIGHRIQAVELIQVA